MKKKQLRFSLLRLVSSTDICEFLSITYVCRLQVQTALGEERDNALFTAQTQSDTQCIQIRQLESQLERLAGMEGTISQLEESLFAAKLEIETLQLERSSALEEVFYSISELDKLSLKSR